MAHPKAECPGCGDPVQIVNGQFIAHYQVAITELGPIQLITDIAGCDGSELPMRTCRLCGCTDIDCSTCILKTGQPCSWIEDDLCSACSPAAGLSIAEYMPAEERQLNRFGMDYEPVGFDNQVLGQFVDIKKEDEDGR